MTDDADLVTQIDQLVAAEHELRSRGHALDDSERATLRRLEERLDQCWDLLRRRKALREARGNPDAAQARPIDEVEGYLQ